MPLPTLTSMTNSMTIMVMKRVREARHAAGAIRVSVAQAKSQLSALLRKVDRQPVVIHNRGHDVACLVSTRDAELSSGEPLPFVTFFNRLEVLRKRLRIAGVAFEPEKAVIRPVDPFEE